MINQLSKHQRRSKPYTNILDKYYTHTFTPFYIYIHASNFATPYWYLYKTVSNSTSNYDENGYQHNKNMGEIK